MESSSFNWVDFAIIGIIAFSILISIVRGFVREALSLVTWIAAIWIGIHYHALVSEWLTPYISAYAIRMVAGFFILFAGALILGSIVSFMLVQFIQKTGLSGTDRSLGVVFGLGRGVVVVSVALLMGNIMFPANNKENAFQQSHLAPEFLPVMDWLKAFLPTTPAPEKVMNLSDLME